MLGAVGGFFAGLLVDTAMLGKLGLTSLVLTIAGYWIGRYGETTGRDRAHAPFLSVGVVTVLYGFGLLLVHFVLGEPAPAGPMLRGLGPAIVMNLILTAPVYALVRRLLRPLVRSEGATEVQLLG
jgi:rod shape-determining protein MreD